MSQRRQLFHSFNILVSCFCENWWTCAFVDNVKNLSYQLPFSLCPESRPIVALNRFLNWISFFLSFVHCTVPPKRWARLGACARAPTNSHLLTGVNFMKINCNKTLQENYGARCMSWVLSLGQIENALQCSSTLKVKINFFPRTLTWETMCPTNGLISVYVERAHSMYVLDEKRNENSSPSKSLNELLQKSVTFGKRWTRTCICRPAPCSASSSTSCLPCDVFPWGWSAKVLSRALQVTARGDRSGHGKALIECLSDAPSAGRLLPYRVRLVDIHAAIKVPVILMSRLSTVKANRPAENLTNVLTKGSAGDARAPWSSPAAQNIYNHTNSHSI